MPKLTSRRVPRPVRSTLAFLLGVVAAVSIRPAGAAPDAVHVTRTEKVCQVVGETDRQTRQLTTNFTETRAALWGTDLGIPVEHQGKLYIFFGDSHPTPAVKRPRDADPIAVTTDETIDGCLRLDFITDADGGFHPLTVPGIDLGEYGVPSGGVSIDDRLFVFATTDFTPANPMGRSVLASSGNEGRSFELHRTISTSKFINISAARVDGETLGDSAGIDGAAVVLWGSGAYRKSHPYLAVAPAAGFAALDGIRYFRGVDPETGRPEWTSDEAAAAPVFEQPCIGELSVAWNPQLARWLMTYNCHMPGGPAEVHVRAAAQPWGPWSEPAVLIEASQAYEQCLINPPLDSRVRCSVSDPGNEEVVGGPYGPYLLARFFAPAGDDSADVFYTMSTWNPYTVVLMRSTLRLN